MTSSKRLPVLLAGLLVMVLVPDAITAQASSPPVGGYQIGAFLDQSHALELKTKLRSQDLFGEVHQKTVNGTLYWVVVVPVSEIPFENIEQKLKDDGYAVLELSKEVWDQLIKR